jgi:hypothetical protein
VDLSEAKADVAPPNKRAGYLLLGLTLLTGVLTAVGVSTDELPQLWRNHTFLAPIAIGLVILAVILGAVAGWVIPSDAKAERPLLLVGNGLLAAGVILTATLGIKTASDRPQPTVTAAPARTDQGIVLDVSVKDSGLGVDDDMSITVDPLFEDANSGELRSGRSLYGASLGANHDGEVSHSFKVEIPPGRFDNVGVRAWVGQKSTDCYNEGTTTGCVTVHLHRPPELPQLSFDWKKADKGRELLVTLTARDIPFQQLRLLAVGLGPKRRTLARARLAPDSNANFDRTFEIPVKDGLRFVCVAATGERIEPGCPSKDQGVVWARLPVRGQG